VTHQSRVRRATAIGLATAGVGMAVVILTALAEVLRNPALTLADSYWMGPLPWTPVGVGLAIAGATVVVIFGTLATLLGGGVIRRVAAGLAFVIAAFWWFLALLPPPQGAYCADCPAPTPDPLTYAYSLPEIAMALLVVPAAVIGALALTAARQPIRGTLSR
jgi:hypothetical protein